MIRLVVKSVDNKRLDKYYQELEAYQEQQQRFREEELIKLTEKELNKPNSPDLDVWVDAVIKEEFIIGYETNINTEQKEKEVYINLDASRCYLDYYICKYDDKLIKKLDSILS